MSLFIIIPAYNEEQNIEQCVNDWYRIVETHNDDGGSRLVIVNDGSKDNSLDALKEVALVRRKVLSHEYIEHLKVLVLNENKKAASQQTAEANKILDLAETPDTPEFREAVKARKLAIRREMKMQDIMEALVEMQEVEK